MIDPRGKEHRYGTTEITERPERIVSVGLNEQDAFFALGVAPVGVTDWMGFEHGIGPWAETAAKAAGDLEARIATAKDDHPEFAGRTASMAMSFEGIWVYGPEDPRSRLLTDLGFEPRLRSPSPS
jgi:ABC-type Fe3+-hydroxamate transport system substrate-binding protein